MHRPADLKTLNIYVPPAYTKAATNAAGKP